MVKSGRDFFPSREFSFNGVENFVIEKRILTSSRKYFRRVENFFLESKFFCRVENFLIESRIPSMPCRHLPPKWSNNMAVNRSVGYVASLYILVVLQVADGNVEDSERFLLSIQDCVSHIERCTAPETTEIWNIYTIADVQGFPEIKVLLDDFLHSLRELLNHIRDKIVASFQDRAEFRSVPPAKEGH